MHLASYRAAYGWQRDGGHADYMLAEENTCIASARAAVSYVDGALMACGFGTVYEALNRVAVSGAGSGADHRHGAGGHGGRAGRQGDGRDAGHRRGRVARRGWTSRRSAGAIDQAVLADAPDAPGEIMELTGGLGCEVSIDCSGSPAGRLLALQGTRRWGRCAMVGEGNTVGVRRQPDHHPQADHDLRLLGDQPGAHGGPGGEAGRVEAAPGGDRLPPLPLDQAAEAYRVADEGQSGKVCIVME